MLEQLAEAIRKGFPTWLCNLSDDKAFLRTWKPKGRCTIYYCPSGTSNDNAPFVDWVQDRIESIGWSWQLDNLGFANETEGKYRVALSRDERETRVTRWSDGKTKAEAVARALLAALSEEPSV